MKKLLCTAAALAFTSPALAGSVEPPIVEPPIEVVEISDWTGFYAGVDAQYDVWGGAGTAGVGVHAGYLHDMGDIVIGAELNYEYLIGPAAHEIAGAAILGYDAGMFMPHVTVGGSGVIAGPGPAWNVGAGATVKVNDNWMLTGRYRYISVPVVHQVRGQLSYQF